MIHTCRHLQPTPSARACRPPGFSKCTATLLTSSDRLRRLRPEGGKAGQGLLVRFLSLDTHNTSHDATIVLHRHCRHNTLLPRRWARRRAQDAVKVIAGTAVNKPPPLIFIYFISRAMQADMSAVFLFDGDRYCYYITGARRSARMPKRRNFMPAFRRF